MIPQLAGIVALHLGALHPFEKVLTLALAFGPFLVLAALVVLRRRHDLSEDTGEAAPTEPTRRQQ